MINRIHIIGNLGRDPELRHTASGASVVNFTVATSEVWRDKQTGDKREETTWHNVTAFGKLAEIIAEYAHKGKLVYVEGRINTRKWQDKEGNERQDKEIVASEVKLLGGKEGRIDNGNREPVQNKPVDDFDDDLPF